MCWTALLSEGSPNWSVCSLVLKYIFTGMFKRCVEGVGLRLHLADGVVWYGWYRLLTPSISELNRLRNSRSNFRWISGSESFAKLYWYLTWEACLLARRERRKLAFTYLWSEPMSIVSNARQLVIDFHHLLLIKRSIIRWT